MSLVPKLILLACWPALLAQVPPAAAEKSSFSYQEAMIPMRDRVRLQTVILAPLTSSKLTAKPLPILLRRTPYGVPKEAPVPLPVNLIELNRDRYIFVIQNLRGRFQSEGVFKLSSQVNLADPKDTNETTDAYDTIDWLIKNVPNNNGKVGIYGVSYDGLTAGLALLHPHPALKAISEQASPADQWMNDDNHRFGALRLSYTFEYAVMEQSDKNENKHFSFDTYDTYDWYLKLGPISNLNKGYLHGSIPFWNDTAEHPDYDAFWRREAWVNQVSGSTVPNLNVAGFWDQEDPWGPWQIFRKAEKNDPLHQNFMVAGPGFTESGKLRKANESATYRLPATKPRASSGRISKRRFSGITCTARVKSFPGKPAPFNRAQIPGIRTASGRPRPQSPPAFTFTRTARSHSIRPPRREQSNMFPIRRTRFHIANALSLLLILAAIGAPGKRPTSALSITGRTFSAS